MEVFLQQLGISLNYTRELLVVALILGRTVPMIVLTPFLGGQVTPNTIKMGLGVLLTIMIWPLARDSISEEIPYTAFPFCS